MPSTKRIAPFGYKWVIRYTCRDDKPRMGLTDHHYHLTTIIQVLLEDGAKNITITDETIYKDK